jgi:hypothetical protein
MRGVEEVMSHPIGYLDGLSNADRENRFYWCYYSPASDDGGHVSVRGLARIFVRRRNLQIFTSDADAARTSALLIDPKLTSRARRARLVAALWPNGLAFGYRQTFGNAVTRCNVMRIVTYVTSGA